MKKLKSHGIRRLCSLFELSESAYYQYVKRNKHPPKNLGLRVKVKSLFELSESAYYQYVKRNKHPPKNLGLRVKVKSLFERGKASAGSCTLLSMLANEAIETTRYQVIKAMKEQYLVSKQPSKKWRAVKPSEGARFTNKLQQQFDSYHALCADVTYGWQ